jgi:hypothetical protein
MKYLIGDYAFTANRMGTVPTGISRKGIEWVSGKTV